MHCIHGLSLNFTEMITFGEIALGKVTGDCGGKHMARL